MSSSTRAFLRFVLTTVVVTSLALAALAAKPGGGPADKVSASGSSIEIAERNEPFVLLSETIKLSTPTDLMLSLTLECSISTRLTTIGNDSANASGSLDVWVEIDGFKVPVSVDDTDRGPNHEDGENVRGEVTLCNRTYQRDTTNFDDEDATITSFIDTRTTHGFNWLALDELWTMSDDNIHEIEVLGRLTQETRGDASARVAVGKRTLIIEPTKVANGEEVTELG